MSVKKEFELIFHIELSKVTATEFGFDSETKIKMKGEFELTEIGGLQAAVISMFIDELNKKLQMAIDGGYNLS